MFFIDVLRTLAMCLITNSHYTGVYPTDLIANGGLLGDIIFFAVSGYCLCNIKLNFLKWYPKRVFRCYLPVVLITAIYMLIGAYSLNDNSVFQWFVYPTYYHFVASIVVLYIPFFIILKTNIFKEHLGCVMVVIGLAYLTVYLLVYDKSYYHIDNVREPFIRFLFFESMLLGAYFRVNDKKYRNRFSLLTIFLSIFLFIGYFALKLIFTKYADFAILQIFSHFAIFALLYIIMRLFSGLDKKLEALPEKLKKVISFLATLTLEIYVVQYVIIDWIKAQFAFPVNWILITSAILIAAIILHYMCFFVEKGTGKIFETINTKLNFNKEKTV